MIRIELDHMEVAVVHLLSDMRIVANKFGNGKDKRFSKPEEGNIMFIGMLGEYAYCKWRNKFLSLNCAPRGGSYDCIDNFIDPKNKVAVDIKTVDKLKKGNLLGGNTINPDVGVFILADVDFAVDGTAVEFIGWCLKEELYKKENVTDLGYGDCYVLGRDKLKSFENGKQ